MKVDEVITFKEAEQRGYNELQFIIEYLEDETATSRIYSIDGTRVLVKIDEEVQATKKKEKADNISDVSSNSACSLDDPECLSCGS